MKEKHNRNNTKNETNKYIYDLQHFQMIRSFVDNICNVNTTVNEADKKHSDLLVNNLEFNNKAKARPKAAKKKKRNTFENINALYEGQVLTLNAF